MIKTFLKSHKCYLTLPADHPLLASVHEFHYGEETTFYSTAVSIVCTVLCFLPSESSLLTVMIWSKCLVWCFVSLNGKVVFDHEFSFSNWDIVPMFMSEDSMQNKGSSVKN